MAKKGKKLDKRQQLLPFTQRVERHLKETEEIISEIGQAPSSAPSVTIENIEDACMELAGAIKKAIHKSGMSRAQIADEINIFFGWPTAAQMEVLKKNSDDKGIRHISTHMMNHYLSKPIEYPIPGAYLYAIAHITGSLSICRSLAEVSEAEVISKQERAALMVGKMYDARIEISRLMNEFKKRRATK